MLLSITKVECSEISVFDESMYLGENVYMIVSAILNDVRLYGVACCLVESCFFISKVSNVQKLSHNRRCLQIDVLGG